MPLYKIYFQDGSTFDGGNSIHESRWLEIPDRSIARLEYFFTEGEGIILQGFESYLCFVEAEATISRPVGNCRGLSARRVVRHPWMRRPNGSSGGLRRKGSDRYT